MLREQGGSRCVEERENGGGNCGKRVGDGGESGCKNVRGLRNAHLFKGDICFFLNTFNEMDLILKIDIDPFFFSNYLFFRVKCYACAISTSSCSSACSMNVGFNIFWWI